MKISKSNKAFTDYSNERERTIHFAEHEIFLSFRNDEDAESFNEWWESDGIILFQKFLDKKQQ